MQFYKGVSEIKCELFLLCYLEKFSLLKFSLQIVIRSLCFQKNANYDEYQMNKR